MGFLDSYKHLEKLCGEMLNDSRKLSAYIDMMQCYTDGPSVVRGWNEDLKTLKRYRWLRNRIVHEPGCSEDNMCVYGDAEWLDAFYIRVMNGTDPLTLYRKVKEVRRQGSALVYPLPSERYIHIPLGERQEPLIHAK